MHVREVLGRYIAAFYRCQVSLTNASVTVRPEGFSWESVVDVRWLHGEHYNHQLHLGGSGNSATATSHNNTTACLTLKVDMSLATNDECAGGCGRLVGCRPSLRKMKQQRCM